MLVLTGCHSISQWNQAQLEKAHSAGKDVCGKRYLKPYMGTPYDDIDARALLPRRYTFRVSDKRNVPPPGTEYVFTLDRKITRVDIYVDEKGLLEKLVCS